LLPGDDAASDLEHGLVVLALLLSANKQSSKVVDPGVHALDHPTPRFVVEILEHRLFLRRETGELIRLLCYRIIGSGAISELLKA